MSLVVNTNVSSLNAQRSLSASGAELKTAMERLSSGKKINSAADDAAGFAIAERMTAQIRGLNMAAKNVNDGLSMIATIENATNDITGMLHRMRELAVQGINDTNGAQDRAYLQLEVDSLMAEINRVASDTQYNGKTVLNGSLAARAATPATGVGSPATGANFTIAVNGGSAVTVTMGGSNGAADVNSALQAAGVTNVTYSHPSSSGIFTGEAGVTSIVYTPNGGSAVNSTLRIDGAQVQVGTEANQSVGFSVKSVDTVSLGLSAEGTVEDHSTTAKEFVAGTSQIDVSSASNASSSLAKISAAIEQVAGDRAAYGALQNRLEYTVSNLLNVAEFTTAARSRIEDADFAAESARLAKAQVLQQSGTAMLAQANASSQLAITLIR
jgi:flagellin